MYCPNCGKQNAEDAKFCPHCGTDNSTAKDAQPTPVAPTSLPPQPVETAAPTPPAAPAPPPVPPPVTQPAAPPPGTIPPPPDAAGAPAKKKGVSCWLIGCGILVALIVLGGIGTCFTAKYAADHGEEIMEDLQEFQSELEQGNAGLVINEGDDSGSLGGAVSDAPPAAVSAVQRLFKAWVEGDVAGRKSLMTADLISETSDDDFGEGYKQVSFQFTGAEEVNRNEWAFIVEEDFRNYGDDTVQSAVYRLRVKKDAGGWKISALGEPAM